MSPKQRYVLLGLMAAFVLLVAGGIVVLEADSRQEREPVIAYDEAPKVLPVLKSLAEEHVTFLKDQNGCHAYEDDRERRANDLGDTCAPRHGYEQFDAASEKRFATLHDRLDDLPYDVFSITLEYAPGGTPAKAGLMVDTVNPFKRDTLYYEPGHALPTSVNQDVECYTIDADWYYCSEDWN
ncbi:hypothetical protein ACFY36_10245 [Actinoplanes sp. NPDC000266]